MKRSNRLVILVGVLLAVLAFVAIVILLNQGPTEPTGNVEPDTATVLVATTDIAIGDSVTPDMVEATEIPVEAVQTGALIDPSQLGNRVAIRSVPEGAQVTSAIFGETTTVDIEGQLEPGEKAIAVQVDPVTGMNFLLQAGNHVDLILAVDFAVEGVAGSPHLTAAGSETVRTVKTVLQNKRVLYVSDTNIPPPPVLDDEGNEVPQGERVVPGSIVIIIAGTDIDAELLTFAQRTASEVGAVTLTLRSTGDQNVEDTPGVVLSDLFETYGLTIPAAIEDLAAPPEEEAQ